MDILKYVLLIVGLLFILIGLTLSISDNPASSSIVTPLYTGLTYLFYIFMVLLMLAFFIWIAKTVLDKNRGW